MNQTSRIYYLSRLDYIKNYMEKTKFKRQFIMKANTQFKFLTKKTQKAVEELISYNCEIKYLIK
jgi:hypothetical protein